MPDCLALALTRQSITTRRSPTPPPLTVPPATPIIIEHFETTEIPAGVESDGSQQSTTVFVPPLAPIDQ
uniref:Uncharacterized protein n=1 Tax=Panagrolaimus sp. ES5 TaxID=591445 RepID=A0AC34GAE6_9BILA